MSSRLHSLSSSAFLNGNKWNAEQQSSNVNNRKLLRRVVQGLPAVAKWCRRVNPWPAARKRKTSETKVFKHDLDYISILLVLFVLDSLGLHRVENPSHVDRSVSLHLYSPPFDTCHMFDQRTGKKTSAKVTFWSKFGERVPPVNFETIKQCTIWLIATKLTISIVGDTAVLFDPDCSSDGKQWIYYSY